MLVIAYTFNGKSSEIKSVLSSGKVKAEDEVNLIVAAGFT
jgi:hypothetical protein